MRTSTTLFRVRALAGVSVAALAMTSALLLPIAHAATDGPRPAPGPVGDAEELAVVAGTASEGQLDPNRTPERWAVEGTDLGIQWTDSRGRTAVVFGDTFGEWGGDGGGGGDWRFNVLGHSTDTDLDDGLTFDSMVEDRPGHAGQLLPKDPAVEEITVIPTAAISVGDRDYIHYMSVRHWGDPGKWDTNYSGLAYSEDGGQTWTKDPNARWMNDASGENPFQMGAFWKKDGYVYLTGTPNGRFGDAHLARVAEKRIGDVSAYTYWNGQSWKRGRPDAAKPIFAGPVGELSVQYNKALKKWVTMYLDEDQRAVVMRTANEITGPWSETKVVVPGSRYAGLYAPYMHPASANSRTVYFNLSEWRTYRVHLLKVTLG